MLLGRLLNIQWRGEKEKTSLQTGVSFTDWRTDGLIRK